MTGPEPAAARPTGLLSEAIANTGWRLQIPRLARRTDVGWLVGYVSAVLDAHGEVDHYQWWVETHGRVAATAGRVDRELSARAAVADADGALAMLLHGASAR